MAFAGVELPDNIGAPTESNTAAPDAAPAGSAPEGAAAAPSPMTDTVAPREYSREELETMLGATQAPTETPNARYEQNFPYDIAAVVKDPSRLAEFSQIYPPAYVEKAKQILQQYGIQTPQSTVPPRQIAEDPRMAKLYQFAEQFENMQKDQRVQRIDSALTNEFTKLGTKYPDADPNIVNWYLQGLSQKGVNLMDENGNLRSGIIEKLFKADHEQRKANFEKKYRAMVESQKGASRKAMDMGSGGNASATGAKLPRSIKEATKNLLNDIEASR